MKQPPVDDVERAINYFWFIQEAERRGLPAGDIERMRRQLAASLDELTEEQRAALRRFWADA